MDSAVSVPAEKLSHKEGLRPRNDLHDWQRSCWQRRCPQRRVWRNLRRWKSRRRRAPLLRQKRWKMYRKSPKKG